MVYPLDETRVRVRMAGTRGHRWISYARNRVYFRPVDVHAKLEGQEWQAFGYAGKDWKYFGTPTPEDWARTALRIRTRLGTRPDGEAYEVPPLAFCQALGVAGLGVYFDSTDRFGRIPRIGKAAWWFGWAGIPEGTRTVDEGGLEAVMV
jgi:hypothetical protein